MLFLPECSTVIRGAPRHSQVCHRRSQVLCYATRPVAWVTGSVEFSVRRYNIPPEPSAPSGTPGCFRWKLGLLLMPDVPSDEECPFYIIETGNFRCPSPQYIHENKQPTSDRLTVNWGTLGIPSNLQLYVAGSTLNGTCKSAVPSSILTSRYLYIPQDFPLLFVIIFLTFPQQQITAPQPPQSGAIGSESSCTTGTLSNSPSAEIQQQCSHLYVHCNAAIEATKNIPQDAHLKMVHKTGLRKNMKQHAIGCESLHVDVQGG